MKKHILLGTALASLFALGACDYNEDNFPGFDEKETITDVSTDTLVLADAHYGKIASMPKNQGIALAKDPEGQTYLTALNQLGKTKMFTDMVAPEDYLPAFVDSLYAYLSDGSKVLVQYNIGKEQPEYLSKINEAQTFDLTSDNYATVWGESMVVKYLTPSTLKKLPALLKEGIKNPKTGDVCQVNYAWSETEPSTGGGAVKMVYQKVTSIDAEGGNYVIVAPTKDNTWIPFGQFKDPDKTGHLLVDTETRWIIEKIFDLAVHGRGAASITRILVEAKVPTPGWLNFQRYCTFANFYAGAPVD